MPDCLNCSTELTGKFCSNCGQRAATQRFTAKTLWDSEFLEQNFNLSQGLPKTLLELMYQPGKVAYEYVVGKRKRYFPFIGLFLMLATIDAVIRNYAGLSVVDILERRYAIQMGGFDEKSISRGYNDYFRLFALLSVPIVGGFQSLILRKLRWNFWEHCVAVFFLICAQLWLGVLFTAPTILPLPEKVAGVFLNLAGVASFIVTVLFYQRLLFGKRWLAWLKALGMAFLFVTIYSLIIGVGLYLFADIINEDVRINLGPGPK